MSKTVAAPCALRLDQFLVAADHLEEFQAGDAGRERAPAGKQRK